MNQSDFRKKKSVKRFMIILKRFTLREKKRYFRIKCTPERIISHFNFCFYIILMVENVITEMLLSAAALLLGVWGPINMFLI